MTIPTRNDGISDVRYEVSYLQKENGQWVRHKVSNDGRGFDIHEAMDKMREISAVDGKSMGFEIRKIKDDRDKEEG